MSCLQSKCFGMKASSNGKVGEFFPHFACSQTLMGNHALSLSHTQTLNQEQDKRKEKKEAKGK